MSDLNPLSSTWRCIRRQVKIKTSSGSITTTNSPAHHTVISGYRHCTLCIWKVNSWLFPRHWIKLPLLVLPIHLSPLFPFFLEFGPDSQWIELQNTLLPDPEIRTSSSTKWKWLQIRLVSSLSSWNQAVTQVASGNPLKGHRFTLAVVLPHRPKHCRSCGGASPQDYMGFNFFLHVSCFLFKANANNIKDARQQEGWGLFTRSSNDRTRRDGLKFEKGRIQTGD